MPRPAALKKFRLIASKMNSGGSGTAGMRGRGGNNGPDTAAQQLHRYLTEVEEYSADNFCTARRASYKMNASLAKDLNSAPASQSFIERIFSLCGLLTAGDQIVGLRVKH